MCIRTSSDALHNSDKEQVTLKSTVVRSSAGSKSLQKAGTDKKAFSDYSREHVHFFDDEIGPLLKAGFCLLNGRALSKRRILDLGCGDGSVIFALYKKELLSKADDIIAVDISRTRIKRVEVMLPFVRGIVSNALYVKELSDFSFDFVVCSQLIEHVDEDTQLLLEIKRLLSKDGFAFISTIVKKPYGVYLYFKDGTFRLDPTHVREYPSTSEFVDLINRNGFATLRVDTSCAMFPLFDLAVKSLIKINVMEPNAGLFHNRYLRKLRRLKVPVLGFSVVEVLVKKL